MKSKLTTALAAAGYVLALRGGAAYAATITETINFTATNFRSVNYNFDPPDFVNPIPAPIDPVTGSFTLTWDPTANTPVTTTGIVVNSFNLVEDQFAFESVTGASLRLGH